jgi:hypothetical protein
MSQAAVERGPPDGKPGYHSGRVFLWREWKHLPKAEGEGALERLPNKFRANSAP